MNWSCKTMLFSIGSLFGLSKMGLCPLEIRQNPLVGPAIVIHDATEFIEVLLMPACPHTIIDRLASGHKFASTVMDLAAIEAAL